jgi:RNA polymerase sigma-70 factor, ECF subfamily
MHAESVITSTKDRLKNLEDSADEDLLLALQEGEDSALEVLIRRYQNDIFRFCLHYVRNVETAKDVAQETFLRVYASRMRFDVQRRFQPWILCIARNLCLNELKRKKDVSVESLESFVSTEALGADHADTSPMAQAVSHERRQALMRILDGLPETTREIIVLRFFERLSARQIAEVVGTSEGAIRTRLHRVLRQLRDQYINLREEL